MGNETAGNALVDGDAALAQVDKASLPVQPPAPIAVGAASEKARLRALIDGRADVPPDPAMAHLPPEEREPAPAAPRRQPAAAAPTMDFEAAARAQAEPEPEPEPQAKPAAASATTDADAEFEKQFFAQPTAAPAAPPAEDRERKLAEREAAAIRAHEAVVDAAREFKRDPIGALGQIGVSPEVIAAQLKARGHVAEAPPSTTELTLPEDATPAEKVLFKRNQVLEGQLGTVSQQMSAVLSHLSERERAEQDASRRAQRQLVSSDAASHIRATALRISALRDSSGKLTTEGELLVRDASRMFQDRLPPNGLSQEEARKRAEGYLAEVAREVGMKPKAQRAERALSPGQRPPVPNLQGATAPRGPTDGKSAGGYGFDFDDDEKRLAEMTAWFNREASQASA